MQFSKLRRRTIKRAALYPYLISSFFTKSETSAKSQSVGGRVVVIGGGFAGATAAKYIKVWGPTIEVTMVEPDSQFVSCPMSNRVLSGVWNIGQLKKSYQFLNKRYGVKICRDKALGIDPEKREIRLSENDSKLKYDRLIVASGVQFTYDDIPSLKNASSREAFPHAWKAGKQTVLLRQQLQSMRNGGVVVITVPLAPYRCPPGPYERACQIAYYLKNHKPRSKIIILDANEGIQSKKKLFETAWKEIYSDIIEYRPMTRIVDLNVSSKTLFSDFEDLTADVVNIIPPQSAGNLAKDTGLVFGDGRWCDVDFLTYESKLVPNIHVIGDAIAASPKMPKSGHMANQHAKVCAAAICALLGDRNINNNPMLSNTCYSFVDNLNVGHVAAVYAYNREKKQMEIVPGSSGNSFANSGEKIFAESWAENIWADMLR